MVAFFRVIGWVIVVIVAILVIGFILEEVVQPILYAIGQLIAFLIKWAFIIGIPLLIVIGLYQWITGPPKSNK